MMEDIGLKTKAEGRFERSSLKIGTQEKTPTAVKMKIEPGIQT
jgi:hypothetical protein